MAVKIYIGDSLQVLKAIPSRSVNCCVTSPPYFGLRNYGVDGQLGLEQSPDDYVRDLVEIFRSVRRVLRDDGTLWLVLGDTYARNPAKGQHKNGDSGKQGYIYDGGNGRASNTALAGLPEKNLIGVPWRVAFALQADGWYLRQDIIWAKANPLPESVRDRCTKSHEYIFLLTKCKNYYFDAAAIAEPCSADSYRGSSFTRGKTVKASEMQRPVSRKPRKEKKTKNKRSVWHLPTHAFKGAHFATFPPKLIEPCILAGTAVGGVVLDPFAGAGTTGMVAQILGRDAVLIDLNPEYGPLMQRRIPGGAQLVAL